MASLLLELFSEEIPARMQARALKELAQRTEAMLAEAGLAFDTPTLYSTPRRLTVLFDGLPTSQPNTETERKGPKVGAPEKAVQGFLKSTGLKLEELETRETPKGSFHFAIIRREGQPTIDVLSERIGPVVEGLPWPKSMRWGSESIRWVRPLHSMLCLLDGDVVPFSFGPISSGRSTRGHRFLSPDPIDISDPSRYAPALEAAHVVLDPKARRDAIETGAQRVCAEKGLELIEDPALLDEVTGLVEYPVPLLGSIDQEFMSLPPEILANSMRSHQKYFSVRTATGEVAPHFVVIANMVTPDDGAQIRAGNERVLRARLADAQFFWDTDAKVTLESRIPTLDQIVFQAKFGEGADRVSNKGERMMAIARNLAGSVGADPTLAARGAQLAKADLLTGVVGEFPELQGKIGQYYALRDGEPKDVGAAIAEHYSPAGPADGCPRAPVAVSVALADKIDTMVGFFAIEEKPTGSKDPFALRRAALGILRLLIENELRVPLGLAFQSALEGYPKALRARGDETIRDELLGFFADRLAVYLRDRGVRHDLIRAVFAAVPDDDFVRLLAKVEALQAFTETDAGANLLAAYRRATNIVQIEEKDGGDYAAAPDPSTMEEGPERALFDALETALPKMKEALQNEEFTAAMSTLAGLREGLDVFFDRVIVNADEPATRVNRLRLLSQIRRTLETVADFSKIEDR